MDVESAAAVHSIDMLGVSDVLQAAPALVRCDDAAASAQNERNFLQPTKEETPVREVFCAEHRWVVQHCNGTQQPALCLNCSSPCAGAAAAFVLSFFCTICFTRAIITV